MQQHLVREPLVQLVRSVEHEALALGPLLALRHQRCELVTLEETRNLNKDQLHKGELWDQTEHILGLKERFYMRLLQTFCACCFIRLLSLKFWISR
jgi:hypothetical protein